MDDTYVHDVLRSLRRIMRKISEHSRELAQSSGLSLAQLMCLRTVGDLEGGDEDVTVKKVGEVLQLSPTTISRVTDRLVRAGLVSRERSPRDRRRVCLTLTLAGAERYETLPKPLQESFIERLGAQSDEEQRALLSALHRIVDLMEAADLDAAPMLATGSLLKSE